VIISALLLAACPVALPLTEELRFGCHTDQNCASGHGCVDNVCVPVGEIVDAGAVAGDALAGDITRPDAAPGDSAQLDASTSDSSAPDSGTPDSSAPDSGAADSSASDSGGTDSGTSDAQAPDTLLPDSLLLDSSLPDALSSDWWDARWGWRRKLVFDNSGQAESLHDFPLLVALDSSVIDYTQTRDLGEDLRFIDPVAGGPLAHEIELWDEGGTSTVWVKVPEIDASSSSDFIWMYYGNDGASDAQDVTAVWSNGYAGVWHMDGDPGGTSGGIRDSSPSGKHGTGINMSGSNLVAAYIGRGLSFDGSQVVRIDGSAAAGDPLDIVGGPLTISAWALLSGSGQGTLVSKREGSEVQWQLQNEAITGGNDFNPSFIRGDGSSQDGWNRTDSYSAGAWYNIAVVADASGVAQAIYMDGASGSLDSWGSGTLTPIHLDIDVAIGARWGGAPSPGFAFAGTIDEVRISSVARSSDWMAAQHLSMTRAFVHFDTLEQR